MDTRQLERFAQAARRQLHEQVTARLDRVLTTDSAELRAKTQTIQELKKQIAASSRQAVVEKVAYTWFNRFCALRYMDVNHYTRIGTVSPTPGFTQPEILQEAKQGHVDDRFARTVDARTVYGLLNGSLPSSDPQQEAYRLLLVGVCNAYHAVMPFMFEQIDDYSELLMPDDLLSESSILHAVREAMTEETCADVEVIGWLYQFYISEKKDAVMARKGAVPSEDIPAVTQLFTPHWIVRYMVENSLGRLWMLNHPESHLIERMDYYIAPEQEILDLLRVASPEEIRLCDSACGSGHILTYAFDLLYTIYEEQGYNSIDIPRLILENNLTGIEIDPRAGALAGFALMMKAREKDRRFFGREVQPDICVIEDVAFTPQELDAYMDTVGRDLFTQNVEDWLGQFEQATTFGSLIRPLVTDTAFIRQRLGEAGVFQDLFLSHTHDKLRAVLRMTEALSPRYHVVVANPPYMGSRSMNRDLKRFAKDRYPQGKRDLCAMFVERNLDLVQPRGWVGMITMQSWMFLSSFEKLRKQIVQQETIETMAHLGPRAFDTNSGEVVSTTAFTLQNRTDADYEGQYFRLVDGENEAEKSQMLLYDLHAEDWSLITNYYRASAAELDKIPGAPIAYWVSKSIRDIFATEQPLGERVRARQGLATGDNDRFPRLFWEVSWLRVGIGYKNAETGRTQGRKWFPINKGGPTRKWYGNAEYVIAFDKKSRDTLKTMGNHLPSERLYFRPTVSWSDVTSAVNSFRVFPAGFLFDATGHSVFPSSEEQRNLLLCYCNNKFVNIVTKILNPTMHFHVGYFNLLPYPSKLHSDRNLRVFGDLFGALVQDARSDWDAYETSWGFTVLPLLDTCTRPSHSTAIDVHALPTAFIALRANWQTMTAEMQQLEEENNRIFIDAYDLEGNSYPRCP